MITKSLLSKIIKTGNLTWVMPNGEINTYGDGTGDPIKIRTTNNFSEIKLLMNPSIHFGESYMNGSLVVEEGRIHDFLKLIFDHENPSIDRNMKSCIPTTRNTLFPKAIPLFCAVS